MDEGVVSCYCNTESSQVELGPESELIQELLYSSKAPSKASHCILTTSSP